jgi:hypothetical protein
MPIPEISTPSSRNRRRLSSPARRLLVIALAATLSLVGLAAETAAQTRVGVKIENRSDPVLCAEKDNVSLALIHPKVTRFRIEAVHPSYIDSLQKDSFEPDWTACDFSSDPKDHPAPTKRTLYEDINLWVVGFTIPNFWRDRKVPFHIGDNTYEDLHLIQIWVLHKERAEEVLVLYPADGYWRARPLAPEHLGWSAYGSSFMVGPVEDAGRPVVNLSDITFYPDKKTFSLKFAGGGTATLKMSELDRNANVLDVEFSEPISGPPFAALRSMYVTRSNNDVADVAVLENGAVRWDEEPIMDFKKADSALEIWAGRTTPSRHNTSAPDMVFRYFSVPQTETEAPKEKPATPKP